MSGEKLDYEKWKTEYPFLKNIWDMYEQFDKPVDNIDRKKKNYEGMCKLFISSMGKKEEDYLDFCMKYLRNLDPYCIYPNICKNNSERCNNLNYWLYDTKIKKKLDNNLISNFYNKMMDYVNYRYNKFMCYYYSYDENVREPENILKLLNFQSNINIIVQILKDRDHEHYCFCEKYIYECVNIYKKMHNTYCSTTTISDPIDNATCNNLRTFSSIYSIFLSSVQNFNDKIPTLDLKNNEFLIECSIKKKEPESLSDKNDNPDNSTSHTVQTALGTAAGISSILAVLYKFTPGRKWLHSRIGGSMGKIHANFYTDGPKELLFDGMEHNDFNSYSIGYEAM